MDNEQIIVDLQQKTLQYRTHIIRIAQEQDFGIHLGGSLSLAEILITLYFSVAKVDPQVPNWSERDRIILSKGHGNIGLLTVLAMRGFFPLSSMNDFNKLGSFYSMHADAHIDGVEHSAGSLGHGLSVAVGMALAGKMKPNPWHVYCILGDGESMEGSIWEAMMSASHYSLDNLTAIIDRNHLSQEGTTSETMELESFQAKGHAFGWQVHEINGHDIEQLLDGFSKAARSQPRLIIANTIKGRGVPSHENLTKSHFAHLTQAQADAAIDVLRGEMQEKGIALSNE
jgi:transketolase